MNTASNLNADWLRNLHAAGLEYDDYLALDPDKATAWEDIHARTGLTPSQRELLAGFTRTMRVLCVSGAWCGDCVQQGPLIQKISEATDCIDLKWLDRDEHIDLAEAVRINTGLRVPTVIFCAEDHELVSIYGDRTLTRYRAIAARNLGPSCPLPGAPVPQHELEATLQDWLDEFERVHLLLRLSTRLRAQHGD
ncbi:MAG: thioredoxin family protein [Phycisphaerales bacterium]|nr:thioredoxin family protein [Phycisphaerales bacterium]